MKHFKFLKKTHLPCLIESDYLRKLKVKNISSKQCQKLLAYGVLNNKKKYSPYTGLAVILARLSFKIIF